MTDRFTPTPEHTDAPCLFVVTALTEVDYQTQPTVLFAGTDEATARSVRNRAAKGRGGYTGLIHVRMATVAPNSVPSIITLS